MKKRIIAVLLVAAMAASMTACSNGSTNGTENTVPSTEGSEAAPVITEEELAKEISFLSYNGKKSSEYDINLDEVVKDLPDYNGLEFELDPSYEVNEASVNNYLASALSQFGADMYKEITDRDVVEANDYVKLDYTGYKDDEAFQGGAATDVLIDIAGNKQVGAAYGFIDGFTDGIAGTKVGEKVKCPVKFPDDYSNDDLKGQDVIFEFNIKGIYSTETKTIDELSDEEVNSIFGEAGFTTNAALRAQLESDLQTNLKTALGNKAKEYLLGNATVEVPADYLDARCSEVLAQAKAQYETESQTMAQIVAAAGMDYKDYLNNLKESVEEQVKIEFIFEKIAALDNVTISDEEFAQDVSDILEMNKSTFADEEALYKYFGTDDIELGKATLRVQLLVEKAAGAVADKTNVKFKTAE